MLSNMVKTVFLVLTLLFVADNSYALNLEGITSFKESNIGMEFVFVKGGCYKMGDIFWDSKTEETPIVKERPVIEDSPVIEEKAVSEVCVNDFYMGKYIVTVGEFRSFVNDTNYKTDAEKGNGCNCRKDNVWEIVSDANWRNPCFKQADNHPVVCVTRNDAIEFAKWLGETQETFRLPTEAEWEYAARSGGQYELWAGTSNEAELGDYAWYNKNSGNNPHQVGQKKPNGLGLYDMSCNVWQWVYNGHEKVNETMSPHNDKDSKHSVQDYVIRGCAWYDDLKSSIVTNREDLGSDIKGNALGFRLVRSKR